MDKPHPRELRTKLEEMVIKDLLGPANGEEEEVDEGTVRERYLVGMLACRQRSDDPAAFIAEESSIDALYDATGESLENSVDVNPREDSATDAEVQTSNNSLFPSSLGLTCCIEGSATTLEVVARWGHYTRETSAQIVTDDDKPRLIWKRRQVQSKPYRLDLQQEHHVWQPARDDQPDVRIKARVRRRDNEYIVTLFLINQQSDPEQRRDEAWLFQPELILRAPDGTAIFRQRRLLPQAPTIDEVEHHERMAMTMRYRHQIEFAIGHGVSVTWITVDDDPTCATEIRTQVIPRYEVPFTTEPTAADMPELADLTTDMKTLSEIPDQEFGHTLQPLVAAYGAWIGIQASRIGDERYQLADFVNVAEQTIKDCRGTLERIRAGIALLDRDTQAAEAFRFANRAMWQQWIRGIYAEHNRRGEKPDLAAIDEPKNRSWRVFQLGFLLLNISSLTELEHPDRSTDVEATADLLWYPTGGGKTEAYLGLTAYTLGIRRLQGVVDGYSGMDGVAVLMRYTLRLLTLQQFQRATALICACEMIRREAIEQGDDRWGTTPFRIGLWVGQRTTPNNTKQADEVIKNSRNSNVRPVGGVGTPAQLTYCPWCGHPIEPGKDIEVLTSRERTIIYCGSIGACPWNRKHANKEGLPVLVVDNEIYRQLPALLIATVDKFAQLPWNGRTQMLFGRVTGYCERHGFRSPEIVDEDSHRAVRNEGLPAARTIPRGPLRPPDLVIQDELHLISGPLGTMVGLYETAIDYLCTWQAHGHTIRPKVIASTATVRQADNQIRRLFKRTVNIFPPPGLDAANNFFAIQRPITDQHPGRRYLGICALGKRQKAAMIRVYVAQMAAAQQLYERYGEHIDPWMTLVGYFNAMRDLGAARRLVEDDITTRLYRMDQRGLARRTLAKLEELTSRKGADDIPIILDLLEKGFDPNIKPNSYDVRPLDVLLATNMIAVGVDVKRLGLMVVNGQPKTTSEYIQATSRVGRSTPGLVCTILNWARPRDLSHYEQFEHYHATFYQQVEALSVTPFSARALDRGLSALLVALIRLSESTYNANQAAEALKTNAPVEQAIEYISHYAEVVMGEQNLADQVRAELRTRSDLWLSQSRRRDASRLGYRKQNDGETVPLLHAPEEGHWQLFTCLNSLRDVEATTKLILDATAWKSHDDPEWHNQLSSDQLTSEAEGGEQ